VFGAPAQSPCRGQRHNSVAPAVSIYAAIAREIQKKGDDARFRKVGRPKFALQA